MMKYTITTTKIDMVRKLNIQMGLTMLNQAKKYIHVVFMHNLNSWSYIRDGVRGEVKSGEICGATPPTLRATPTHLLAPHI